MRQKNFKYITKASFAPKHHIEHRNLTYFLFLPLPVVTYVITGDGHVLRAKKIEQFAEQNS